MTADGEPDGIRRPPVIHPMTNRIEAKTLLFNGIPSGWRRLLPSQISGGIPLSVNAIRMCRVAPPLTKKQLVINFTPSPAVCNLGAPLPVSSIA
jgi:hypothetical protein